MLTPIILNFEGDPTEAHRVASEMASSPVQDKDYEVSIKWSAPCPSLGMTESTIELLGMLGVISLPVSIFAGVAAYILTQHLMVAKQKAEKDAPETANKVQQLVISVTFVGEHSNKSIEIKLDQPDETIQIALTDCLASFTNESNTDSRSS